MLIFCHQSISVFCLTFGTKLIDVVIDTLQLAESSFAENGNLSSLLFPDGSPRASAGAPHLVDDDGQSEPSSPHYQLCCQYSHLFLQGHSSNAVLLARSNLMRE